MTKITNFSLKQHHFWHHQQVFSRWAEYLSCLKNTISIVLIQEREICSNFSWKWKNKKAPSLRSRHRIVRVSLICLLFPSVTHSCPFSLYHVKRYNNLITSVWMLFYFSYFQFSFITLNTRLKSQQTIKKYADEMIFVTTESFLLSRGMVVWQQKDFHFY